MLPGYQIDCATAFPGFGNSASDWSAPDWRASTLIRRSFAMTPLSKTVVAAAALAAMATSAFSQVPWEFNPGMAYMYSGPGKMTAMAMASTSKNHEAMMKDAKKVPENTVFFMDGGQLFSVSGTLDPTGNFYRP
jgi:hypothetical protein